MKASSPVVKSTKKQKPSPSTLRMDLGRKEEFLKQKMLSSNDSDANSLAEATFHCEIFYSTFQTKNG